ncbi:phospholipid carrier-dependent glycosyltransferase [Microbacterium sp. zg.Y625]|uniref:dolichyl-phosphate-mannose--protein mannosyltransferase n=1 Tax=Microbacterium jiangjiandongii TaxID=3049071 RepID=UPI00214AA3A7|nr:MULTISPECIES: phospholipid carrier-dependent glycosyltransferase [unclassified Microbacterium]MCR2791556.1 phospholipid carrier-dependent glycosyltransferase [Microbacterium sp. zg.Y625]WIM24383.1 phospholipid carrier-dependent glycosyltransferase [Microbacterium sp. zg-Y625]
MTAETLLPEAPSWYDRLASRVRSDPRLARRLGWIVPLVITAVAGILRLWNLGHPHAIVFDETYYVKDAWSQWNLGYAATWPEEADAAFAAGDTDAYTDIGSFVVHPPLGKWIIGAGMALFGPDSSFGWRVGVALAGTAAVLVLYFVARALSGSLAFAAVASGLMAVDGLAISMSRVALLDTPLMLFVLLAFWFALLDRAGHLDRLAAAVAARRHHAGEPLFWGPVLWNRPWLIAAGTAAGAAAAVKWSGVWVLAAIGLYAVVTDALARRRVGVWQWPTDAVRQGAASFVLLVPVAAAVYLASWTGWLVTEGGYGRHTADASPAGGVWAWVPAALQSLWTYHQSMYASAAGMASPHGYASPAWQWPLLLRPTSMYAARTADGEAGCAAANGCMDIIYSMPNPLVWWAAAAATVYLVYRFVVRRAWRDAFVLTAIAATWVPWLFYPERTVFQFYTVVILPFSLLALTLALQAIAAPPGGDPVRRRAGQRVVIVFLAVALLVSAFWYPLVSAVTVPYDFWRAHNWLPGWI